MTLGTSVLPKRAASVALIVVLLSIPAPAFGAEIGSRKDGSDTRGLKKEPRVPIPELAPASNEGESTIKRFKVAGGLKVDLWAAEPMLANPVAFCIDEQGRVFVSETYRYRTSVLDIRHYMFMLEDDLACRTVDDRVAMIKKHFGAQAGDLAIETEVIRVIEDRAGVGKADFSAVYADKFNTALDGIASGVLARKGKVYFTNIPELWVLDGIDNQGHALKRASMSHGYGVRFSFTGHDMHGLAIGPDGKLYYSIGDRGSNVKTREGKTLAFPDEGAVFRCNLDGSELEVIYRGLRNPQELAFDKYGNLFTGDNDFDHGDEERLVYIVEGGDSGWRVGYQHAPLGFDMVAWKSEHIWLNHNSRQADYNGVPIRNRIPDTGIRPAAYMPPISNIGDGPSGLVYNPGVTGLPSKYENRFFLCHFKGSVSNSKLQSFGVKPKGAGFELTDSQPFIEGMQPTDVDFGPDGALYFADWGEGWERTKKGRIFRVFDTNLINNAEVLATKKLINQGMDQRPMDELGKLLAHADLRVRQEAQFSLADRGAKSLDTFASVARQHDNQLARLHAIWGLGQIGRAQPKAFDTVLPLVNDPDAEVRAQAVKVLGEGRVAKAYDALIKSLADSSTRVRFFAANALGKLGRKEALPAVFEELRANDNQDAFVRLGCVMALVGINDVPALAAAHTHISAGVRMGAVLALRKLERPEIAVFLKDPDPAVVIEAARAINDVPINDAMPALGTLVAANAPVATGKYREPFLLRAINANFRVGNAAAAKALAALVADNTAPDNMKGEALQDLGDWAKPAQRDVIMGVYRPLPERSPAPAADALRPLIAGLIRQGSDIVKSAAIVAAEQLGLKEAGPAMSELVADTKAGGNVRVAALSALAGLRDPKLSDALKIASTDANTSLRTQANKLLASSGTPEGLSLLGRVLNNAASSLVEKQGALDSLGAFPGAEADKILAQWLDRLLQSKPEVPPGLTLDILMASAKRTSAEVQSRLKKYEDARSKNDELASYREVLTGGDAAEGRKIFYERADAQCLRCHKVKGEGSEVGPDLTEIAKRQPREYLLEALVLPNKVIAQGFESVVIDTKGGDQFAGVFKGETDEAVTLVMSDASVMKVKKTDIQTRRKGLSAMPEGFGQLLSKRDLRNLVEFLASLK